MTGTVTEKEFRDALRRGEQALLEPYAVDASFNARTHVLAIRFTNGLVISIDARKSPLLAGRPGAELAHPYVTPGGDGLVFDGAALSVSIPGLVAQLIPADAARRKVASVNGRTSSEKKSIAARANGAKGGRPRGTPPRRPE